MSKCITSVQVKDITTSIETVENAKLEIRAK
jgi:hypothetical protein